MGRKFLAIASAAGFALALAHGSAFASHSKDEQGCVNAMNKDLSKMVKFEGKNFTKCVKDRTKSKVTDAQTCFDNDPKGKVGKQSGKTTSDETKKCSDKGVTSVGGYTSGAAVNAAGEGAVEGLASDVFGGSMSGKIDATGGDEGKCQAAVTKRLQKIVDAKMKEFIKCKKDLLKGGGDAIDTCVTPSGIAADAKSKIDKARTKLGDDITKKCDNAKGGAVDTDAAFPGNCVGYSGSALRDCLDAQAECRVCQAINAADGLDVDCYVFSGSGAFPTDCPAPTAHKCTLLTSRCTGGFCDVSGNPCSAQKDCAAEASNLLINTQLVTLPPQQTAGAIDIDCGDGTLDGNGKAPCTCEIQSFDPIPLLGIGTVCITGAGSCPAGEIDCDGGNNLSWDTVSDHNIGACTSNADCASQCATACGGAANVTDSGCENFCEGGANDGLACTQDTDCTDGACNGPDGGAHGNVCGCQCLSQTGPASSAGDIACQMPTKISVVLPAGSPCTNAATINLPPVCIPLTTGNASGTINNANNAPGSFGNSGSGSSLSCPNLFSSVTSGGTLVGVVNFFDSTLGDLSVLNTAVCQ